MLARMFRNLFRKRNQSSQAHRQTREPTVRPKSIKLDETAVLELLSMFESASNPANRIPEDWQSFWFEKLGTSFMSAVGAIEARGLLREPTTQERLDAGFTVAQLKGIARSRALKTSGRKADLLKRILESDTPDNPVDLPSARLLICSAEARDAVSQYKSEKKAAKEEAMLLTQKLLEEGRLREASEAVCDFETKQFFPRGLGVDWSKQAPALSSELNFIFSTTPRFHKKRFGKVNPALRVDAAQSILWGHSITPSDGDSRGGPYSGDDLELYQRMLVSYARFRDELEQIKALVSNGMALECEIVPVENANTTCTACLSDCGKTYAVADVPELPHEDCECAIGCRCTLVASVKD